MGIKLFETNKRVEQNIDNFINKYSLINIRKEDLEEVLKSLNLSFSVEKCSRLVSHILCENCDSYTQQSQRYVVMGTSAYVTPEEIKGTKFERRFHSLMDYLFKLYDEMTREKEGEHRGRGASPDKYAHGIPIEDGRYLLPLATTTNVFVTLSGNNLVNLLIRLKEQPQEESKNLADEIINQFKGRYLRDCLEYISERCHKHPEMVFDYYKKMLKRVPEDGVKIFDSFAHPLERVALGGVTSTHPDTPSSVHDNWHNPEALFNKLVSTGKLEYANKATIEYLQEQRPSTLESAPKKVRQAIANNDYENKDLFKWVSKFYPDFISDLISSKVLGYGHESIAEHSRTVYGTMQSLTSYHQFERHRLPENYREPFEVIPVNRKVFIPPTIQNNPKMLQEFKKAVYETKMLRAEMLKEGHRAASSYLLLNADGVKVITSSNARIDKHILEQRTCNNAQWEIRDRAIEILDAHRNFLPYIYDRAGPPCTKSKCPEGELSCGKSYEMRQKYGDFRDRKD